MKIKLFLLLIISFLFINVVHANDIKNISMNIYLDNNGNAHIKEQWIVDVTSGTEIYKPYYNIKDSNIVDYKVVFNSQEFITIPKWDVNASFEEKSYKAGINKIDESDIYELCFGVTQYGLNTYEFDYTITNFVIEASDADVVYWTLVPNNLLDSPEKVYIKIYSDFVYNDSLNVWGYGNYGGEAYVSDGYIEVKLNENLKSDEYMAVLIKFPKEAFNNNIKTLHNFDYYYKRAEQDATHYENENSININNHKDKKDCL